MKTPNEEEIYSWTVLTGAWEIDFDGRVWSVKTLVGGTGKAKLLRPCARKRAEQDAGEYLLVRAMREGIRLHTGAHRLVYRHFHGVIPLGMTVNHKDGKKKNNNPGNLELATYKEQALHARQVLKVGIREQDGEQNTNSKLTAPTVQAIRQRRAAGEPLKSLASVFGVSVQAISKITRYESWTSVPWK